MSEQQPASGVSPKEAFPPAHTPLPPLSAPETVRIGNGRIGLTLGLHARGQPEILAFGAFSGEGVGPMPERAMRINGMDRAVPTSVLLPAGGMGFFGWPAIAGHREGRDFIADFSNWTVSREGGRTVLEGIDAAAKLRLGIEIEVFAPGVLAMRTVLTNEGENAYALDRCMAGSLAVGEGEGTLGFFRGMWGREFHWTEEPLGFGLRLQESRRGRTSHDRFPGMFVVVEGPAGREVFGIHLGWSGNHVLALDTLDDGRRLLHAGELFEPGEVRLEKGQAYRSPRAFLTAAGTVEAAARRFRDTLRESILRFPGPPKPRPVTFNTWEGTLFDHEPKHLLRQAEAAAKLGIERFVLDDGWFGRRDSDTRSLGDWTVDRRKYPDGLGPLVEGVRALGMEFGIWFEPEMVNEDSDLFRAHPDWALAVEGRPLLSSRRQLVLDLSRPEVSEYLFGAVSAILGAHPIAYVKWDMNRDLTHVGGADGRAATGKQVRAFYALLGRLREAHPDVEWESCASGGGRADYGVMAYAQRLWTSDDTDALERLEIQRGASLFFPPAILGAHISAAPNHQTGRRLSLSFRAVVALAYHLGVEMDPLTLVEAETAELAGWIALHKRLRPLLHEPGAEFALRPEAGRYIWGVEAQDRIVVFVAQKSFLLTDHPPPLRLSLDRPREGEWRVAGCFPPQPAFVRPSLDQEALLRGEKRFSLETLRRAGLPLASTHPESGFVLELERMG